ncbi:hypothetical protein PMAYCL1PPCAC_17745, partial [Pristionchus mayeri]
SSLSVEGLIWAEASLSFFSSLSNLLLLYIVRRFVVFHDHLRALVFQCHLFVLLSNLFILFRGTSYLLQSSYSSSMVSIKGDCPSESTPIFFIGLFLVICIVIGVERSYASQKYEIYEEWKKKSTLDNTILAFWVISGVFALLSSVSFSLSPIPCPPPRLLSSPLNHLTLPLLIFGVFFLSFIPVFYFNYTHNEATVREYIRTQYSSFSSRYQLNENKTTSLRFLVQNVTLSVLCLSLLVGSSLVTNGSFLLQEIQCLFYPLAGLLISLNFLYLHPNVYRQVLYMYWDGRNALYIILRVHYRKEAVVPLLPT